VPFFILPRRFDPVNAYPTGRVRLQSNHPLAAKLAAYYFLNPVQGFVDLVTGDRCVPNTLVTWGKNSPRGLLGADFLSSTASATTGGGNSYYQPSSNNISMAVSFVSGNINTSSRYAQITGSGDSTGVFVLGHNNTTHGARCFVGGGGGTTLVTCVGLSEAVVNIIVGTYNGATLSIFANSGGITTTNTAAASRTPASITRFILSDSGSEFANGTIFWAAYWKGRTLTTDEVTSLIAYPYAFLEPAQRRIYFDPAAAAATTNYVMSSIIG
jgi:hypothetical protein